ncbi:hypothetical protein H5410_062808 [Solanum commersonii]|uniref:Uncharacterized protein n=1 Tax=Solanum commersonii TaxID=4109 RepID=A0A9J5WBT7_SOLCO|nr:hypothetical protein H5410_062808 [Solanum commersonii]
MNSYETTAIEKEGTISDSKPPDPPDRGRASMEQIDKESGENTYYATNNPPSFKDMLTKPYSIAMNGESSKTTTVDSMEIGDDGSMDTDGSDIHLTKEEKQRIYEPWSYYHIIKIFERKLSHIYLKQRLATIWKVSEKIILIDLDHNYHIVKFLKEEIYTKHYNRDPGLSMASSCPPKDGTQIS